MGPFVFQRKPQLASVTNDKIARYPRSQGGFLPALSGTKETWLAPDDPLATVLPTPHDRRGGARRRCPAPIWVQHSPPGRSQHATRCYVSGFVPEFAAPCFRRKLMCFIKLRLFLSGLGWTATLDKTAWRPPVGAPVPRSSGLANRFR